MTLRATLRGYLRDALTAFHRAPAEVALAVLAAALLSYTLERDVAFEAWAQVGVAILIAFMAAWAGTLLHAMGSFDAHRRWGLTIFGAVVGATYALLVDDMQREAEAWRALVLAAGAVLLALAASSYARAPGDPNLRLRRIDGRIILRAIGIGLYGLALYAGLALALAAIQNLFELKFDEKIYGHTFAWIMLVLVPWVIVGGLDSYLEPLERVSDVARVVQRLTSFLVPPLLALYYLILLLYIVRILGTGELPKNLVSPMVLAAGILSGLAILLFDPQPDDTRTGQRALRWAPALFVVVAPLGFWALLVRIDQYGWTEFRLLRLLLLGLLVVAALLATWQLLRRRPFALRVLPVLLGVPLLLSAIGPWSAMSIARRDQQHRLREALAAARVDLQAQSADTTARVVPRAVFDRINNTAYYLQSHFGAAALAEVVGPGAAQQQWALAEHLRLAPAPSDSFEATIHGALPANARIDLSGGTLYRVQAPSPQVGVRDRTLHFQVAGLELQAALDSVMSGMQARTRPMRRQPYLPAVALAARDSAGQVRGELVIFDAALQQTRDSVRVVRLDAVLILR